MKKSKIFQMLSIILCMSMIFQCITPAFSKNVKAESVGIKKQSRKNPGVTRDTVLVLDNSGSMSGKPLQKMKEAALKFCEGILNSDGDNRIAVVKFDSKGEKICDFTANYDSLKSKINSLNASGGTNTTEGMELAYKMIKESHAQTKNLVLMTDGQVESGKISYNGPYNSGSNYGYANALYHSVKAMHQDCNVYTMGFFHSVSASAKPFLVQVLTDIQNAGYYEIEDVEDLEFIFGAVADDISKTSEEKEEYVRLHKEFLAGQDYPNYLQHWDAANDMLKSYGKLFKNYLSWKAATLNISDNPYDIILSDLILSEDCAQSQVNNLDAYIGDNLYQISDSLLSLIDSDGSLDTDTRNAIQKLIEKDDMSDKKTFEILSNMLDTKVSQDKLNKFFNAYADMGIVKSFFDRGKDITNTVIDLVNYAAVLKACTQTSKEFRQVLMLTSYTSGDTLMQASIQEYCSMDNMQDVSKKLRDKILSETGKQAYGIGKDIYEESLLNGVKKFLLNNMDLSKAGQKVASNVTSFIEGCKIGHTVGKGFCNLFFNSDDTADTFLVAYASAKLTSELKYALESCAYNFQKKGDYDSAKLFCQAFSLYAQGQIEVVDKTLEYLGAQQDALMSKREEYVSQMYCWLVYKVQWKGISCHDPDIIPEEYKKCRKNYITIACPTDVQILDAKGNVVVKIENGVVQNAKKEIAAIVSNGVKHILLPDNGKYHVKITSVGNGSMQYAICKFQENNKMQDGILCKNIKLSSGKVFEGDISTSKSSKENAVLMSSGQKIKCESTELEGDIIKTVKLNKKKLDLYKGKTYTLKTTIVPLSLNKEKLTWKSSKPAIASVSSKGVVTGKKKGKTTVTVTAAGGAVAKCEINVKEIRSKKVSLSKSKVSLYQGRNTSIKAKMNPRNSTDTLKWTSSNKKILDVSSKGVITGKKAGTAYVKVTTSSGKKAKCKVTVKKISSKKVKLNKSSIQLKWGKTYTLKPTVTPKQAIGTLKWTSSNKKIATVSSKGVIKGVSAGTTTITVTASNKKKAKCKVKVIDERIKKLEIKQKSVTMNPGETQKLDISKSPSNAKEKVSWKSSDSSIASVSSAGSVSAKKTGHAVITAYSSSGKKSNCSIEVVRPAESLQMQEKVTLISGMEYALDTFLFPIDTMDQSVIYTTDNSKVAIVSGNGVIRAKQTGTAKITAKSANGKKAVCEVTVIEGDIFPEKIVLNKSEETFDVGKTVKLTAEVLPDNAMDKNIIWSSSNQSIATVENGVVTGVKEGKCTITAKTNNGCSASCQITVENLKLNYSNVTLYGTKPTRVSVFTSGNNKDVETKVGESSRALTNIEWDYSNMQDIQLKAYYHGKELSPDLVEWSSKYKYAYGCLDSSSGMVYGGSKGSGFVTMSLKPIERDQEITAKLKSNPAMSATVKIKYVYDAKAQLKIQDPGIASVDENGMVYGKKVGTTELIIKENLSGKTDSVVVKVTQ